jgi:hypothetical protein
MIQIPEARNQAFFTVIEIILDADADKTRSKSHFPENFGGRENFGPKFPTSKGAG